MGFENDLLDLCRLNQLEEHIVDSTGVERDATMQAIDWKKRQLANRLVNAPIKEARFTFAQHTQPSMPLRTARAGGA
jgi:hypothetical protein